MRLIKIGLGLCTLLILWNCNNSSSTEPSKKPVSTKKVLPDLDPNKYNVELIPLEITNNNIRCTLDTKIDLENILNIYTGLDLKSNPNDIEYKKIITFIESRDDLLDKMKFEIKNQEK